MIYVLWRKMSVAVVVVRAAGRGLFKGNQLTGTSSLFHPYPPLPSTLNCPTRRLLSTFCPNHTYPSIFSSSSSSFSSFTFSFSSSSSSSSFQAPLGVGVSQQWCVSQYYSSAPTHTPQPSEQPSFVLTEHEGLSCSGCGALLQSDQPSQQGYVSREKLLEYVREKEEDAVAKERKEGLKQSGKVEEGETELGVNLSEDAAVNKHPPLICKRCFSLKNYNTALNITLKADDYLRHLSNLSQKRALILLVVDVTDFPGSFFPDLHKLISKASQVMVVANKIDLLPERVHGLILRELRSVILGECEASGVSVAKIHFTSAKLGTGIDELSDAVFKYWGNRGDVYLLGCTNAGKSSIFNHLLESLCGARPGQLSSDGQKDVPAATISHWPGTTLGLLSFPIISVGKRRRLQAQQRARELQLLMGGGEDKGRRLFSLDLSSLKQRTAGQESPRDRFRLYDTPGAINEAQLINLLTTKELNLALPKKPLKPRTFILKPGQCLLLAGLGRLDYVHGEVSAYFTVFAASALPVHVSKIIKAESVWTKNLGTPLLEVPFGSAERLALFPPLQPQQPLSMVGTGWNASAVDVIFSSAGWVAVTVGQGKELSLMAHTPGGVRVFYRTPSLWPSAICERGKRSGHPNKRATFIGKKKTLTS